MNHNTINPSWFVGVVEDINDPAEMGRVRVRCFGYHTENKQKIPTASLPWASVSMPITSTSMGGIGQSATGILQGTWVLGMFIDGEDAQNPLIFGTLPSRSATKPADDNTGFFDPSGNNPVVENDIDIPLDATSRFAESAEYIARKAKREALGQNVTTANGGSWSAPLPQDNQQTVYPHSKVRKTESGFVEEIDDTPTKERFLQQHKSGTHTEILPNGDRVTYIEGSEYVVIKGKCQIYVDSDLDITASGDINLKSEQNVNIEGKRIGLNESS